MNRKHLSVLCNLVIALLSFGAWLSMLLRGGDQLALRGLASLRFFTVLSNLFNGLVCLVFAAVLLRRGRAGERLLRWKLAAAAAVGVTFTVVAVFLVPLYGYRAMLRGANFHLHLLLPLGSMLCFCLLDAAPLPRRACLAAVWPPLLYGLVYLGNILLHGVSPATDWYHFAAWGIPLGLCIFAAIVLLSWLLALGLRAASRQNANRH